MKQILKGLKRFGEMLWDGIVGFGIYFKDRGWQLVIGALIVIALSIFIKDLAIVTFTGIGIHFLTLLRMFIEKSDFDTVWREYTFPRLVGLFIGIGIIGAIAAL